MVLNSYDKIQLYRHNVEPMNLQTPQALVKHKQSKGTIDQSISDL